MSRFFFTTVEAITAFSLYTLRGTYYRNPEGLIEGLDLWFYPDMTDTQLRAV